MPISSARRTHFNPPTPCGVGRPCLRSPAGGWYFNPPTPCGVGPFQACPVTGRTDFNPPTPCGVGLITNGYAYLSELFQSTHPVWGGTGSFLSGRATSPISIHPPRVGWDSPDGVQTHSCSNFNPPTPCGVGPQRSTKSSAECYFNPPTPCGVGLVGSVSW